MPTSVSMLVFMLAHLTRGELKQFFISSVILDLYVWECWLALLCYTPLSAVPAAFCSRSLLVA